MAMGRIVRRGSLAALALTGTVIGLTWLNQVASSVMAIGGSCGSGGPYEVAHPCPEGAWMAPVGILGGLVCLGLYAFLRPSGSPQLLFLAWPALFGSLGVQFIRAAMHESQAFGWWVCGVVFLAMALVPVAIALTGDPGSFRRALLGSGRGPAEEVV
jgi:hypothetical protein